MRKLILSVTLALGVLFVFWGGLRIEAAEQMLGKYCGDVGPLPLDDPTFCGCTWGQVLFNGQPVAGAVLTLTFKGEQVTDSTHLTQLENWSYYDLTAHDLGAQRGDVMTLTAEFAGQRVSRTIRAWPDATGEQQVTLAFPELGVWETWGVDGYTRTLALGEGALWAGGTQGIAEVVLSTGVVTTHTLPWGEQSVLDLAIGGSGRVWAVGPGGVAEWNGAAWLDHSTPLIGTPRVVVVDPVTDTVWVAGGDTELDPSGGLVVYTGTWQSIGAFADPVTTLTLDEEGCTWVGTWGAGIYRLDGSGWTSYRAASTSLPSDWLLSSVSGVGGTWWGMWPYLGASGPRGGIARYDLAADAWRAYTLAHGLPADAVLSDAPAPIYALTSDNHGWFWAGTVDGIRYLPAGETWLAYTETHGLRNGSIRAIAGGEGMLYATDSVGLVRLNRTLIPGEVPIAQILDVSPLTLTHENDLLLSGGGFDGDESDGRTVAWSWSSNVDGPLCTETTCRLPWKLFSSGTHILTFRVQDDEGAWSVPVTATVYVQPMWQVYLPLVISR
jgi:hypothetical protein